MNLARVRDRSAVERIEAELNELLAAAPALKEEILALVGQRMVA